MEKNRAHINEKGDLEKDTKEGIDIWLDTYEKMKSNGATEKEAKKAADEKKEKMDKVCSNAIILDE